MKIAFFGSSQFAVEPLKSLIETGANISCVVTQPDKRKGRGLKISSTPVKEWALKNNLNIYQPVSLKDKRVKEELKNLKADIFIVIAYGKILPPDVLGIPASIAINLHASLLPKYRGAAPINWAIINGEKETGVSIIKMSEKMDAGQIISQRKTAISPDDTRNTLEGKLSLSGADLLIKTLTLIENNSYELTSQDEAMATYAPLLKKKDGMIRWDEPAEKILNLIKGCQDWPGAFCSYKGKVLKIWEAKIQPSERASLPGTVINISQEGISVNTAKDSLSIHELQLESGKRMNFRDFVNGHKIKIGDTLT